MRRTAAQHAGMRVAVAPSVAEPTVTMPALANEREHGLLPTYASGSWMRSPLANHSGQYWATSA